MMKLLSAVVGLFIFSSCSLVPDVANIVHDVCDTAVCVEVNEQALKKDTDTHITVDVINKDKKT